MWTVLREPIVGNPPGTRVALQHDDAPASFADVLAGWRDDPGLRAATIDMLASAPYRAFFWEMPPLRRATLGRPYECALLDSRVLAFAQPEPLAFRDKFDITPAEPIAVFGNLGGDATLIAPCLLPAARPAAYTHIAAFVRAAPEAQRHALLQAVAATVLAILDERPAWLSTSGLGVPWLHVRLDRSPKYYCHGPYKEAA